ncbi:DUF262 domain-containing protein [Streptomyces rubiginosohelvolus]|uniref:DUF262 domain-containing protein n=1 Tax=Streptomyces rubiginosohelvolus TaxID=67362 RepID=UPI0034054E57
MAQNMQAVMVFSLRDLVRMGEAGRFRSSAFSRPAVWDERHVAEFFDSVHRGFPVGQLVVYEGPAPAQTVELGGSTIQAPEDPAAWTVIDGLQRLSALIGAWNATETSRYALCYDLERRRFVPGPAKHLLALPVPVAVRSKRLWEWVEERPFLSEFDQHEVLTLANSIADYQIPVTVVKNLPEQGYEVFRRLNQGGAALSKRDLERATASTRQQPHQLQSIVQRVESQGFGRLSIEAAAQCAVTASITQEKMPASGAEALAIYSDMPVGMRVEAVDRARMALGPAVGYLREFARIPHLRLLPLPMTLPVLVRIFHKFGPSVDPRTRELLRRWVWRADGSYQAIEAACEPVAESARREAQRLLDSSSAGKSQFYRTDLTAKSLTSIAGRLNALGMLHAWPSLLAETPDFPVPAGYPLEAPQVLTPWLDSGNDAFNTFLSDAPGADLTLGGFVLHPPASEQGLRQGLLWQAQFDPDSLQHHFFDDHIIDLLKAGRFSQLVREREALLAPAISRRVQHFARRGFRDAGRAPTLTNETEESHGP